MRVQINQKNVFEHLKHTELCLCNLENDNSMDLKFEWTLDFSHTTEIKKKKNHEIKVK